jgi:hypothetical protein
MPGSDDKTFLVCCGLVFRTSSCRTSPTRRVRTLIDTSSPILPCSVVVWYVQNIFMPDINNEKGSNATYSSNLAGLEKMVLVKALGDTVVVPNESEWFAFYKVGRHFLGGSISHAKA